MLQEKTVQVSPDNKSGIKDVKVSPGQHETRSYHSRSDSGDGLVVDPVPIRQSQAVPASAFDMLANPEKKLPESDPAWLWS